MEGISTITYKGKQILVIDYSSAGSSKEKTLQIMQNGVEESLKHAPKSLLTLVNVTDLHFDSTIINAFKSSREKIAAYEKKTAVFGMKGLQKVAYNFVASLSNQGIKAFDTETEAKEWLVTD